MNTVTTSATPVVRTTKEFGFEGAQAVTFSGRRTLNGPVEVFACNRPRRGFNCKDGSVSITNRSGNWGNNPNAPFYERVFDFTPMTVVLKDGTLNVWKHNNN